jgi:hypothetical protein
LKEAQGDGALDRRHLLLGPACPAVEKARRKRTALGQQGRGPAPNDEAIVTLVERGLQHIAKTLPHRFQHGKRCCIRV